MYTKALELLQIKPSEAMMVASHAYDLRAAKKVYVTCFFFQITDDTVLNVSIEAC